MKTDAERFAMATAAELRPQLVADAIAAAKALLVKLGSPRAVADTAGVDVRLLGELLAGRLDRAGQELLEKLEPVLKALRAGLATARRAARPKRRSR